MLWSVVSLNSAIVSSPSSHAPLTDPVKKEKRGIFGFGAHGHHSQYAPHYDDLPPYPNHNHHHPGPPIGPLPPHPAPVNLGAHFHTTVTKKIGVPIPYPYPVKVRLEVKCSNLQNRRTVISKDYCAVCA